jgi:8-oxo-dGTP pyrophosphatase MutT (NUDIX family)
VAEPLFEQIRALLHDRSAALHSELPERGPAQRAASVLVPLYMKQGEPYVVLTKRTDHLSQHPGQISFPGGGRDPEDADAAATALREAEEEIGLDRTQVDVLGPLDLLDTITGFRVSPFVGAIPADYPFKAAQEEVAEILQLPLQGFLVPGALTIETREFLGAPRRIYGYTVHGTLVWGATGRIVHHFLELIQPLLQRVL